MEQRKAPADLGRPDAPADATLVALESTFIEFFHEGQAQERRRITREIHDSTMQLLSCLGLSLARLKQAGRSRQTQEIITEMEGLLGEAQSELRTLSYLANPPPLEAMGLHDALEALVAGFGRRSGLKPAFHWQGEFAQIDHETEIALYRVVQEALSNVHRHARAVRVAVTASIGSDNIELRIVDDGLGMPSLPTYGVGIIGMRARMDEVGGQLSIRPASPGTEIIATAPTHWRNPYGAPTARAKLHELCASCLRTADSTADERISAALRDMGCQFEAMASCMGASRPADDPAATPFTPAIPLLADHKLV